MSDWIEIAMRNGGSLSVEQAIGIRLFRATMTWGNGDSIKGEWQSNESAALGRLNEKLREDAADEMVKKGVV